MPSQNQAELAGGSAYHHKHGRLVLRTNLLRLAGWFLLILAILLLAAALTMHWFG